MPKIHSVVGGLAALAVAESLVALAEVADMADGGNHYPLFMLTLQNLHRSLGKQPITQLFNESKVGIYLHYSTIDVYDLKTS